MVCSACKNGIAAPFEFTMAFQPIFNLHTGSVWCYEALVRGIRGEGAATILKKVNAENKYQFDRRAASRQSS
jgi:EAL domain-containing protein (putative c-di-GMP-specific phosphodiesterase class I)